MATKDELKRAKEVEAAIRSLFERFRDPDTRYGCSSITTQEIRKLSKDVEKRKEELKNDTKLIALNKKLTALRCDVAKEAKTQHHKVDDLLREFQLRGFSEDLVEKVEALAKETPAWSDECVCDDEDDD